MVPQLLQVVKIPHLRKGTRVGCRVDETPTGTIKTACRALPHAPSKATAANASLDGPPADAAQLREHTAL
jgi:hypothetical protein